MKWNRDSYSLFHVRGKSSLAFLEVTLCRTSSSKFDLFRMEYIEQSKTIHTFVLINSTAENPQGVQVFVPTQYKGTREN